MHHKIFQSLVFEKIEGPNSRFSFIMHISVPLLMSFWKIQN